MIIWHNHHIVPRHMGGTNDPRNLLRCNAALHSFLHKLLYEQYGYEYDKVASLALSGQITMSEIKRQVQNEGRKKGGFKKNNKIWLGRKHKKESIEKTIETKRKKNLQAFLKAMEKGTYWQSPF